MIGKYVENASSPAPGVERQTADGSCFRRVANSTASQPFWAIHPLRSGRTGSRPQPIPLASDGPEGVRFLCLSWKRL